MKKNLIFILLFLCTFKSFATDTVIDIIKLSKKFKVSNTFSGDLSDTKSFHLIFSKNKKNKLYTIHSYLFDGENIQAIQTIENKEEYQVVSFHQKDDTLTLLLSYKKKKNNFLNLVSIDLKTKKITEKEPIKHDDFSTSFREKNRSVLIYKSDDKIIIKEFVGANQPYKSEYIFNGKNDELNKLLKDKSITSIKTDEFVANGAIGQVKGYLENKSIIITKQYAKENETDIVSLSFKEELLVPSKINTFINAKQDKIGFKKYTSYYNSGKLYQLALGKKSGKIKISDTKSNKDLNTIILNESLSSKIKGNKEFQGIENFLKNAGRNKYNATITVNPTKSKKVRIRVDYVNQEYSYHYNWWWHHHQFMMWQNQMNIHHNFSAPSGFGPSQPNDFVFESISVKKAKRFFEILIDSKGLFLNEELPETIYKEVDKKEYINKLEDLQNLKHKSSCFLKHDFRYIGYSKNQKGFVIKTDKIK